ncbi:Ig-like domain repeat protein [Methanobrevibacter sp.]
MTNDLTTVEGVLQQAIDDLETNLQSMGVIDAEFNPVTGILGLISRITEIEPAVAGLDLDTNITCLCESPGSVGVPLNITGILSASYDDTTATDVDLSGVLQNATVKIYNGNTLLGTAVTDNNGRYTFEYTPLATGVLSIIAIFEGTENYDNCQSSNITVDIHSLTLSSSADIVSAGDTVTLTATHLDESNIPIENETITFEIKDNSDEVIDTLTAVTDSSGIATVSYLVQGSESLYIQAKGGIILSEICEMNIYKIVTSSEELDIALTNAIQGDSIYIKNGTYSLSQNYNIPCISIIGEEENPPIFNVANERFFVASSSEVGTNVFENLQFRGANGGILSNSQYASVEIRNCNWKNMVNQYNFHAIKITAWSDDKYVLIEDCEFINNYTIDFGHFCTNIHCIAPNGPKNLTVRNCVFNATRNNGTNNVQGGHEYRVALNVTHEWANSLSYVAPTNCYFCNNQYLHSNDTLYGFTRDNCP